MIKSNVNFDISDKNNKKKEIFISAGDFSGDMHASFLVKNFKKFYSNETIQFSGIGGSLLKNENINFLFDMVKEQGFGFGFQILKKIFTFRNILKKLIKPYLEQNKDHIKMVILVDFYGFNIHIAKLAKSFGIKVVYYIAPQIWATRKYRIKKIKKFVDIVIPILPFEKNLYENNKIESYYFGNPLCEIINENLEEITDFQDESLIGIMPGSRLEEINKILPIFLKLINMLFDLAKIDAVFFNILQKYKFVLVLSENIYYKLDFRDNEVLLKNSVKKNKKILDLLKKINIFMKKVPDLIIVKGPSYNLRSKMRFILTASGTATLENTLLSVYMLIFYKVDFLSYFIAKLLIKVKFIGLPNILAGKLVCFEFIQKFNFLSIANDIKILMKKKEFINQKKKELAIISESLFVDKNFSVIKQIVDFLVKKI